MNGEAPIEILLVEDSPTDALLTTEALGCARIASSLHHVQNGEEALAFLRGHGRYAGKPRPALILLDLNLPRKSGLEVLQEVKADESLKLIPTVVLTTSQAQEDVARSYGLHANCYVCKPVEFSRLAEVVRSIQDFWFGVATLPPQPSK